MGAVVVRYRPRPEEADHNQELVEAVFAELAETDPGGVRYATRCVGGEGPDPQPATLVGSYRYFVD